jgi:glycosyltransferase involved in cell wall biosynthesis
MADQHPAHRRPPISVVVPSRNRIEMLSICLAALRADLDVDDEIVVADSASYDAAGVARVALRYGAKLVRSEWAGASRARNAGWQRARHELVGFVDDDVIVRPGWADAIAAGFGSDHVAFVTGRVVVPEHQANAERPVAITSRTVREPLHSGLMGDLGASANLAVRRSALDQVGGFDQTLGPGTWAAAAEDLDLFDRLFRLGLTGLFEPDACAEHDQWRSRRQLLALDWRYGKGMGVRLARLATWDRPRARRLLKEALVTQGMRPVLDDLRHGYEFGAATVATRTVATIVGLVAGLTRGARTVSGDPVSGTGA